MGEGKPTGIKSQDIERLRVVVFEGRPAQLYRKREDEWGRIRLELDVDEGPRLVLYGYLSGDNEFMEMGREIID